MAVLRRVLYTWIMHLVFMILLALRLDDKVTWNWYVIFTPLWMYDLSILAYVTFHMVMHCKNGYDTNEYTMAWKVVSLVAIVIKLIFQVVICLKLQYVQAMPLYYAMLPAWFVLAALGVQLFCVLLKT